MKVIFPFQTPKQYLEARRIMQSTKPHREHLEYLKQKRYKAYLQHSEIGYFPNGRKDSLSKKIKNFFLRLKDELTFDDLD